MLIIRILPKTNEVSLSHPCAICAIALGKSKIFNNIIYSVDNSKFVLRSNIGISTHHIPSSQRQTIKK